MHLDRNSRSLLRHLVGEDGDVLAALQDLMRIAVTTQTGSRAQVTLDIAGHRARKRDAVRRLGLAAIEEARRTSAPVRMAAMTPFERKVLTVVSRIPVGRVTTYGDVARMAGRPGAARAVGNILREAARPGLPYHRVIAAGGRLGGYSNLALKRSLLAAEGLTVAPGRVVSFARVRWSPTGFRRHRKAAIRK